MREAIEAMRRSATRDASDLLVGAVLVGGGKSISQGHTPRGTPGQVEDFGRACGEDFR